MVRPCVYLGLLGVLTEKFMQLNNLGTLQLGWADDYVKLNFWGVESTNLRLVCL